ncbi:hypothetical protein RYB67_09255 [Pseudomonas syringae]|nr:hypothetical protein [Pseudomonas syringae]
MQDSMTKRRKIGYCVHCLLADCPKVSRILEVPDKELKVRERARPMGPIRALIFIFAPVTFLLLATCGYPTMIERRAEAIKREKTSYEKPAPVDTTIEAIMPDGKRVWLKE